MSTRPNLSLARESIWAVRTVARALGGEYSNLTINAAQIHTRGETELAAVLRTVNSRSAAFLSNLRSGLSVTSAKAGARADIVILVRKRNGSATRRDKVRARDRTRRK
jgi:hypothetical protein